MSRWIFTSMLVFGLCAMAATAGAQNSATAVSAIQAAQQGTQSQSAQPAATQSQSQQNQSSQAQSGQSQSAQSQSGQAGAQQNPATPAAPAPPPAARATDVASPDAILAATYDVISGPAGQKRDWDRFRSLFSPGARLIAVSKKPDGKLGVFSVTPDQYATYGDPYFAKNGFFERESARHADRYGNIMQIFSTYESRHDAKDANPFARGINSFQLFFDGARWWVVTIYWQEESADNPLPKEYLPPSQ
ncbi:MAG TPA: hypothetical protein VJR23_05440 [Candidatus Acidoferrales bacterium]|nr:hypothetical protein [Candidatus Acidoferrales bacterium]